MKKARAALTKAWEAKKDAPFAASLMITVAMGDETGDEKEWFQRAIEADPGYEDAYRRYGVALMPRWGGSLDALLDFGVVCSKSDHHEEGIPLCFLQCISRALADSAEDEDAVWKDPRVWPSAKRVYEPIVAGLPDAFKHRALTEELSVAWRCGAMQDARAIWKQLNGRADERFLDRVTKATLDRIRQDMETPAPK